LRQAFPADKPEQQPIVEEGKQVGGQTPVLSNEPPPPPDPPTIWYHGERSYSIDRLNPVTVTIEENSLLTLFVERDAALDTATLTRKSGVTNVSRVMGQLAKKFPGAMRNPGRKGKGEGYYASVRKLPSA
jgi:hypothetical protein